MIGKIVTGKSFRGCLQYCLHDKIADEKKNELVMKDRAEVILYNQCFGNAKELIQQFNEVRQLNPRLIKARFAYHLKLVQRRKFTGL